MKITLPPTSGSEKSVHFVEVNGTNLAYVEKGSGEPVIFVHGGLSDYRAWLPQHTLVSRYFRSISYSRRYHYPNEWRDYGSPYSLSLQTQDLLKFIQALDLDKVHLVGLSYGASIALLLALEHPELVKSLILGEPGVFIDSFKNEAKLLLSNQKTGFNEVIYLAGKDKREWAVRKFLNVIVGADVLDQLPKSIRSIIMENSGTLLPMLRTYYEFPTINCKQLKQLSNRTLLISGEFSPRIYRLNNDFINSCLSNSEIVILQGASHGLHLENPEGFNKIMLEFLLNRQ